MRDTLAAPSPRFGCSLTRACVSVAVSVVAGLLRCRYETRRRPPQPHALSYRFACTSAQKGLVSEVVVPLLSMQSSVLLCISTLLDGSNHYSKMIALRDETGKPVFESIAISLVCDACLKSDHPEKCINNA